MWLFSHTVSAISYHPSHHQMPHAPLQIVSHFVATLFLHFSSYTCFHIFSQNWHDLYHFSSQTQELLFKQTKLNTKSAGIWAMSNALWIKSSYKTTIFNMTVCEERHFVWSSFELWRRNFVGHCTFLTILSTSVY